jgi:glycosyltransferase involved in cell wall biosynthesis
VSASAEWSEQQAVAGAGTRPRLLFIVNVDWFFESHRLPIALEAVRLGYDVHLACAVTGASKAIEAHRIVIHPIELDRSGLSPFAAAKSLARITNILEELRPDIVHLVTIKPVLFGGIAARLKGVKRVVAAISGLGYVFISTGLAARVRRQAVALMYRLAIGRENVTAIFQNDADARLVSSLAGLRPSQVRIIRGSGVDLERFAPQPFPAEPAVVTFAARLLVDKGLREFVSAAHLLRSQGVDARFVVAGDLDPGNPASIEPGELDHWQAAGVVEFTGHCEDVASLFAASHIVVLPSYREGMPKVLLEAAASGRPVIATDVPGCRDAMLRDVSGLLVPVRTVEQLAAAIKSLVCDPQLRATMGGAGRRLAEEEFDVRRIVETHLAIYGELMERVA